MTISLNTDELKHLVSQHMQEMGLVGNYEISFKARNQGNIDTSIEIVNKDTEQSTDESTQEESNTDAEQEDMPAYLK